uniref:Phage tail tube protein n=1 Tax=Candidatus Kentrum sp. LFY TaxID=2126342 RepID=A0A450UE63_9GAMM|nr:MAG: Phage tail tube protein [Candidatus Kentron sp. LFY]
MARINNIRTVSIPSIGKLPLADNAGTFTPSGVKREHKPGRLPEDGGFSESGTPAQLEININLQGGIDIDAINRVEKEDVTVRLADGQVYLMAQAFVSEPVGFGDNESRVTIIANLSEKIS